METFHPSALQGSTMSFLGPHAGMDGGSGSDENPVVVHRPVPHCGMVMGLTRPAMGGVGVGGWQDWPSKTMGAFQPLATTPGGEEIPYHEHRSMSDAIDMVLTRRSVQVRARGARLRFQLSPI
jgi:hypothetical protein